jgi:hypothetical protein
MSNSRVVNGITVVPISGKDYVPVAERLRLLHEAKKDLEIVESAPLQVGDRWVWRVVCLIDGKRYCGSAEVHLNAKPGSADATDPFAVAETSAVGRCLGFAGWGSVESICSADELLRGQPGTQITVIEATRAALPAPAQQPTIKSGPYDTKARLNALFAEGKRKLGWSTKRDMVLYVANALHRHDMTVEGLLELSCDDLQIVGAVLSDEPGLEQAS